MRRKTGWCCVALGVVLVSAGVPAAAHDDPSPDGTGRSCDTWYRPGHEDGSGPSSHEHVYESNDLALGGPDGTYVHNHGGHYVVRGRSGYVEVVGGQGYNRNGNQGGYVQGEADPGPLGADADFHAHAFAGPGGPYSEGAGCVSVLENKVGDEGRQPGP